MWTINHFAIQSQRPRPGTFFEQGQDFLGTFDFFGGWHECPIDNVNLLTAVLNDDAEVTRKILEARKRPEPFPTMLVPGGMQNPIVRKLGLVPEKNRPNLLFLRPDGSIAGVV